MPRTQIIGKTSPFTGNLLFEILGNLKNYGLRRVVVRNSHKKQFPETCYYIVRKVVPIRETIGPGPEELMYGNVWAEEVFGGRRMKGLKLLQDETYHPDWKFIPKDEEHAYLNIEEKVELKKAIGCCPERHLCALSRPCWLARRRRHRTWSWCTTTGKGSTYPCTMITRWPGKGRSLATSLRCAYPNISRPASRAELGLIVCEKNSSSDFVSYK